jgi:hypothetical protein
LAKDPIDEMDKIENELHDLKEEHIPKSTKKQKESRLILGESPVKTQPQNQSKSIKLGLYQPLRIISNDPSPLAGKSSAPLVTPTKRSLQSGPQSTKK